MVTIDARTEPVQALPLERLRERTSEKWREYDADVIPMFVAETDFPLAPAITAGAAPGRSTSATPGTRHPATRSRRRTRASRSGATGGRVDPAMVRSTADVSMGIVEILRRITSPGDRVVVTPPVYPPFYDLIEEAGAVDRARSARCAPRPAGSSTSRGSRPRSPAAPAPCCCATRTTRPAPCTPARAWRRSPASPPRFGVRVVSDEIHAPLTQPDVRSPRSWMPHRRPARSASPWHPPARPSTSPA